MGDIQTHGAGSGTLIDHNINEKILHGTVKIFFHSGIEAVDLINKKDVPFIEGGKQPCQIPGFFNDRTAGGFDSTAFFIGDDVRQSRFSQSRRSGEQQMPQRFITAFGGTHIDFQTFLDLALAGKTGKIPGTEGLFRLFILPVQGRCNKSF